MEPHGMVEAGHLHRAIGPRQPVGQQCRVEQCHVAGIGNNAGVQYVVVWQRAIGPNPHALTGQGVSFAAKWVAVYISLVNRARSVIPLTEFFLVWLHARFEIGERLGLRRTLRHQNLMFQAFFMFLKTRMQIKNVFAVLNGNDTAS